MPLQAFLGCIRRFQLRARLGRPWQHRISPLTDPTVRISRSGFVKRTHRPARRGTTPEAGQIFDRVMGT